MSHIRHESFRRASLVLLALFCQALSAVPVLAEPKAVDRVTAMNDLA